MSGATRSVSVGSGQLYVVIAALLWGTTGTAAALAPSAGPIAIGAAAMCVGGVLQALCGIGSLRRSWRTLLRHPWLLAIGAVSVAVYPLAFYLGMHRAGIAVGTVVALASGPIFAALLERVCDGVRLDRRWCIAAAIGVLGTVLLTAGRAREQAAAVAGDVSGAVIGVGLALVAGITYALYTWAARRLMGAGAEAGAAMGGMFGIGGVLLIPVLLLKGAPFLQDPVNLAVGAYLAFVPMFLGYVFFGAGLRTVSARTATLLTLIEPAVAAVLAWWIIGEQLDWLGVLGLGCLAACLAVCAWPKPRIVG